MSLKNKNIIFDLDGVIINSESVWQKGMDIFLEGLGQEKASEAFSKKLIGISEKEAAKLIKEKYLLRQDPEEIIEMREEIIRNLHAIDTVLFPGVFRLLLELEYNGISTALATSSSRHLVDYVLAKFGLRPYFNYVLCGDEVKKGKPHPEIYLETASRMNVKPNDCLVIEDSINGIKAARAAGMKTIAVLHDGKFSEKELKRYRPEKVIKRIKDLDIKKIKQI